MLPTRTTESVIGLTRTAALCQACLSAVTSLTETALRTVLLDASSRETLIVDSARCAACRELKLVVRIA